MTDAPYFLRSTAPADADALNALYARLTGIARSVAQWRWEWRNCPGGPAPSWVIVERATGRVVGHHGAIPVALRLGGAAISAARTENTMVDPDIRSRVRYPALEAQMLAELLARFDLIYTTSGKGAQRAVRERLGYRSAGPWRTFVAGATAGYLVGRVAGAPAGALAAAAAAFAHGAPRGWVLVDTDDIASIARAAAGWEDADLLTPDRSEAALRWRLVDHPYNRIRLATLSRAGATCGFVAWHEAAGPRGTVELTVDDIVTAEPNPEALPAALRLVLHRYRHRPARLLVRAMGATAERLAALGLRASAANGAELLVRSDRLPPGTPWEGTTLIAEGI